MSFWQRLGRIFRLDRELDDELRSHLAMAVRDRVERGQAREDAERDARREFGNELLIKEVTRSIWAWDSIEGAAKDLQYAVRQIRRSPGFAAVSLLCLAFGLGTTVTMFSIVSGILLQPLGFRDSDKLYLARTVPPASAGIAGDFPVNARHFHQWKTLCRLCESTALVQFQDLTLAGEGEPTKLAALSVSADFFRTLGVQPALGRDFLPDEGPGRADRVILSDALWRSRFAGDPAIVGRTIRLNGEEHTVVGVMPSSLHLPKGDEWGAYFGPAAVPVIFRPLMIDASRQRPVGNLNYSALIRIKESASAAQVTAELNALVADCARDFGLSTKTILVPFARQITGRHELALWLLFAMIAAVLLIVCVNIGNLMLVRTAARYREAGVRMALGASRRQLLRLVLIEAGVLVAAGGIAGLGVAQTGLRLFLVSVPVPLPRLDEIQVDWRAMLFFGAAIALSTILCGLLPALRLSRVDPLDSLRGGMAMDSRRKVHMREALVGLEVALSTVLLVVAGLLLFSFLRVMRVEKGFEVARITTQDVSYLSPKYAGGVRRHRVEETVNRISQIPEVEIAAAINLLPLRGNDWVGGLEDPKQPPRPVERQALTNFRFVTPGYWQALGIPLKRGRLLNDSDKGQLRAVISERAAQHLWPGQDPLGKYVRGAGSASVSLEVVGVVGEVRAKGLEQDPPIIVYEHYWRMQPVSMSYIARTRVTAGTAVANSLRAELASMDPEMAIVRPWTMEEIVSESVALRRFQMYLALAFATCALLLASLGVYGVVSYTVARRTPEMGVRVALGATGHELMLMVLSRGMRPVAVGSAIGLGIALVASRAFASQLFQVSPWNLPVFAGVTGVLLGIAVAACWLPARRAASIDPIRSLRFE